VRRQPVQNPRPGTKPPAPPAPPVDSAGFVAWALDANRAAPTPQDLDMAGEWLRELATAGFKVGQRESLAGLLARARHAGEVAGAERERESILTVLRATIRSLAPAEKPEQFNCPTCGPGVAADEDGCCAACGSDCVVAPADAIRERDLLRAEIEAWRALDWERWPTLATLHELPQERAEYQAALDALNAARAAVDAAGALNPHRIPCTECSSDPCICPSL